MGGLIWTHLDRDVGDRPFIVDIVAGVREPGRARRQSRPPSPDGYTVGVIDSAFVINPGLFAGNMALLHAVAILRRSGRSPPRRWRWSARLRSRPTPRRNWSQSAKAQTRRDHLCVGSCLGTAIHLAGEQFRQVAGVEINHIPYRGGGPSVLDLIAGKVNFTFSTIPSISEQFAAGVCARLGSRGRSTHLPDVPSMAEAGLAGVDSAAVRHGRARGRAGGDHRAAERGCGWRGAQRCVT